MKNAVLFVISSIFLIALTSCSNIFGDMMAQYNSGFNIGYTTVSSRPEEEILKPGDPGFKASSMLREEYYVRDDATLNLGAPKKAGASFKWWVTDPHGEDVTEKLRIRYFNGDYIRESYLSDFIIYIPESELESPHTYVIHLTVSYAGEVYNDSCGLIIFEHVNNYQ